MGPCRLKNSRVGISFGEIQSPDAVRTGRLDKINVFVIQFSVFDPESVLPPFLALIA